MAKAPAMNEKAIMGQLQKAGYSKAGSAAIVGNIAVESGHTFNPGIWQYGSSPSQQQLGSGQTGFGLSQWTDAGRQQGLVNYAKSTGGKVGKLGTQVGYITHELQNIPSLNQALKTGGNVASLAADVQNQYEEPASRTATLGEREGAAQQAFSTNWHLNAKPTNAGVQNGQMQGGNAGAINVPQFTVKNGVEVQAGTKRVPLRTPETAQERQSYYQNLGKKVIGEYGAQNFSQNLLKAAAAAPAPAIHTAYKIIGTTTTKPTTTQASGLTQAASMAMNHDPNLGKFTTLVNTAKSIDAKNYNYEWGGGHDSSFAPTHYNANGGDTHGSGAGVGYDCSGVLSKILNSAGLLNQPLVAGQFADLGHYISSAKPGAAPANDTHSITIYANNEHTFAHIGNSYFGTSEDKNPGGGAGFFHVGDATQRAAYTAGYQVWHIDF